MTAEIYLDGCLAYTVYNFFTLPPVDTEMLIPFSNRKAPGGDAERVWVVVTRSYYDFSRDSSLIIIETQRREK